jgi:hypothetical protein
MMPKLPISNPSYHLGTNLTAQDLLNIASTAILTQTTEPVTLGPLGCGTGVPRGAFKGDVVCVSSSQQTQAAKDNAAATSPMSSANTNALNYTDKLLSPLVPYGVCKGSLVYRQAYMGDYVCVTTSTASEVAAGRTAGDDQNALGECCIQPSVRKILYFMLLRRNSRFQSGYSNLARFKLRRPIPVDHSH